MKTLEDLTPELRKKIEDYKSIAKDDLYSGKEYKTFDRKNTVDYIYEVYSITKKEKPVVIMAKNPWEYKKMFNALHTEKYIQRVSDIFNMINNAGTSEKGEDLSKQLNEELSGELDIELPDLKIKSHWVSYCSIYSRSILSWYHFIHEELKVDTSKSAELKKLYSLVNKTSMSRCFFTEGFVLVLQTPNRIIRNANGFHNIDGPAITFLGGYNMYYVNGRKLTKEMFFKISNKEYTFDDFTKEGNEDIKSAAISLMQEKFGDSHIATFFENNLKEIDTYTHINNEEYLVGTTKSTNIGVYTLFRGNINDTIISYVRCYCPSTDRMFFLGVMNDHTSAKDAIASLYRVPRKLNGEIKYIQRQGERFSTVFSDKGKSIIKGMEKKDFQDVVSVSGNEYFSKMRYEY
jgi:hypothetical protein